MAGMYGVYHGPEGLKYIAEKVHNSAATLANKLEELGFEQENETFFDTIAIKADATKVKFFAEAKGINFYYPDNETVTIAINETTTIKDLNRILGVFSEVVKQDFKKITELDTGDRKSTRLNSSHVRISYAVFCLKKKKKKTEKN